MCNTVAQVGAQIVAVGDLSPQPTASGGTFANGTYVLTAVKLHRLPSVITNPAGALTAVIAGNTMNMVSTNTAGQVTRVNYTLTITGSDFALTETCKFSEAPASAPLFDQGGYTAEPTLVRLFVKVSSGGVTADSELFLTKQ
jgi:hypothetical protein